MDDNRVFTLRIIGNDFRLCAHINTPPTRAVRLNNAGSTGNNSRCGEVWPGDVANQLINADLRVLKYCKASGNNLAHIVRWYICCHAHRNAGRTVNQQVRSTRWKHNGDVFRAVVVFRKIDRVFLKVSEQRMGQLGHSNLGVSHCSSRVAVDRAKITLAVDQRVTQ